MALRRSAWEDTNGGLHKTKEECDQSDVRIKLIELLTQHATGDPEDVESVAKYLMQNLDIQLIKPPKAEVETPEVPAV